MQKKLKVKIKGEEEEKKMKGQRLFACVCVLLRDATCGPSISCVPPGVTMTTRGRGELVTMAEKDSLTQRKRSFLHFFWLLIVWFAHLPASLFLSRSFVRLFCFLQVGSSNNYLVRIFLSTSAKKETL